MAALLKSLFFVCNISFLRNYRIKYYDYNFYCKMVEWDIMYLVCIDGYFLNFSFLKFMIMIDTFKMHD